MISHVQKLADTLFISDRDSIYTAEIVNNAVQQKLFANVQATYFCILNSALFFYVSGNTVYRGDGVAMFTADDEVNVIAANPVLSLLAIVDDSGGVSVLDVKTKRVSVAKQGHSNIAYSTQFKPGLARQFVSGGFDCKLKFWDYRHRVVLKEEVEFRGKLDFCNPPHVHCIDWCPSGKKIIAGLGSGDVAIIRGIPRDFRFSDAPQVTYLSGHSWIVSAVQWLDEDSVLSASLDKSIWLWKDDSPVRQFSFASKINCMALSPSNKLLVGLIAGNEVVVDFDRIKQ